MADLGPTIVKLKGSWMTGQPAVRHAPEAWQSALAGTTAEEAELRLVVLAGQAADVALQPVAPVGLNQRRELPSLSLPSLPNDQRAVFRRVMEAVKADRRDQLALIRFLSGRGWAVHPFDWMPASSDADAVPNIYLPWLGWLDDQSGDDGDEELSEEAWDAFFPAERRALLLSLRNREPAAARALIQAKAGGEAAERRLALISILEVKLTEEDAPYLETLASDRSGKVKALAVSFLARLGIGSAVGDDERELADFLKVEATGILDRSSSLRPKRLKTAAQKNRRATLFSKVSLSGLASALQLSQSEVVERWDFSKDAIVNGEFFALLAETAPDDVLPAAIKRWLSSGAEPNEEIARLFDRLAPDVRAERTAELIQRKNVSLSTLVVYAGDYLGHVSPDEMLKMPVYRELIESLKQVAKEEPSGARTRRENLTTEQIFYLGLLLDASAAEAAIGELIDAGLAAADPNLAMLRLNAALPPSTSSLRHPHERHPATAGRSDVGSGA